MSTHTVSHHFLCEYRKVKYANYGKKIKGIRPRVTVKLNHYVDPEFVRSFPRAKADTLGKILDRVVEMYRKVSDRDSASPNARHKMSLHDLDDLHVCEVNIRNNKNETVVTVGVDS